MLRDRMVGALVLFLFLAASSLAVQAQSNGPTYTTIDVPGTTSAVAYGINNKGDIVGVASFASHPERGWVLTNGSFKFLGVPNNGFSSYATGINDSNQVVGYYYTGIDYIQHGFLYSGGTFTTIDPPGSAGTACWKINNAGVILGRYFDANYVIHVFTLANGTYTTIDYPGANATDAGGINNKNQVVGSYNNSQIHGFVFANGNYFTTDFPGAYGTVNTAINDNLVIVGAESAAFGERSHGFRRSSQGKYAHIDYPDPSAIETDPYAINNHGVIVGSYLDSNLIPHAMMVTP
jgi:probable HAF family extracellular repeat protein